jgi:restriction system protein
MLVGEAFRRKGFAVTETGGGGADGGVDLVLAKDGEKFLVQCKQWRAFKVGVNVVRELYGVMAAKGAAGGYVVTSGQFTPDAKEFASGRNITMMDGAALRALIGGIKVEPAAGNAGETAPACPSCGSAMVRRVAKRGANAGNAFWGCTQYPACKGVRGI